MRANPLNRIGLASLFGLAGLVLVVGCPGPTPTKESETLAGISEEPVAPKVSEVPGIPKEAVASFNQGTTALEQAEPDLDLAIEKFQASLKSYPGLTEAHLNLGLIHLLRQDLLAAEGAFRKAASLDPDDSRPLVNLGKIYSLRGNHQKAIETYEEILRREPKNLDAMNNLATTYLNKEDESHARMFVKQVLIQDPTNAGALNTLGLMYWRGGNRTMAQYLFTRARKSAPRNADILNNLGLLHYEKGAIPTAVKYFIQAVAADPFFTEARMNLGTIYLNYLDYARAEEAFGHALGQQPDNEEAVLGHAAALYGLGRYDQAVEKYERYYATHRKDDHVAMRLAKLYEQYLNNPKSALKYYKIVVDVRHLPEDSIEYRTMKYLESQVKEGEKPGPGDQTAPEEEPLEEQPLEGASLTP